MSVSDEFNVFLAQRMFPVNYAANFSIFFQKFGTEVGHVTADALQTLKVMKSKVMVMASNEIYQ